MVSKIHVEIPRLHKGEDSGHGAMQKYRSIGGKDDFVVCGITTEKPESALVLGFEGYTHCLIPAHVIRGCKKHGGRYILDSEKTHLNKECSVSEAKKTVVIQKVILVVCDDGAHRIIFEVTRPWGYRVTATPVSSFLEPLTSWQQGYRV